MVVVPVTVKGLLGKKALMIGVMMVTELVTVALTELPEVGGFGVKVRVRELPYSL
jgi:hypothetical protein